MSNPRLRTSRAKLIAADGSAYLFVREELARNHHFGRRFVVVFEDAHAIARTIRSHTALRLFTALPFMLSPTDFRRLDQKVLAAEFKTSQPVISRALSELVSLGILEREGRGPGVRYRLSPRIAWRGTAGAYQQQQEREGRNYATEAGAYTLRAQLTLRFGPDEDDDKP